MDCKPLKKWQNVETKPHKNMEKMCSDCNLKKSVLSFRRDYRNKNKVNYQSLCKVCESDYKRDYYRKNYKKVARKIYLMNADRYRVESKERYRKNKDKYRINDLFKKYGITLEEYKKLLDKQNNKCAICSQDIDSDSRKKNLSVDHCHKTGRVRGLLCSNCNSGLGFFKESVELLGKAKRYLNLEHSDS